MGLLLRLVRSTVFFLPLVSGLSCSCIGQNFKQSYAIVIGIDTLSSPRPLLPRLSYARKDAEAIAAYLAQQGYRVTALFNEKATRHGILTAFEELEQKLNTDDRVLIFFAGHGESRRVNDEERGYIVPYDGKDYSSDISYQELQDHSRLMKKARHQLFILDTCFSGLMIPRGGPSDMPDIEAAMQRTTREVIAASGKNQSAYEPLHGSGAHSFFTDALLRGLNGDAHHQHDGYITFSELVPYLVAHASGDNQTPAWSTLLGHDGGDYVFAVSGPRRPSPAPAPVSPPKLSAKRGDSDAFSTARELLLNGQFAEALPLLRTSAEAGNSDAMLFLGMIYNEGRGVAQDYQLARQWFERAAAAGRSEAMLNLGTLYSYGYGVKQSDLQARQWYQKAAAAGNPDAMAAIGLMYQSGKGVPVDLVQARQWYEKGAMLGGARAMYSLAFLYAKGEGVQQDFSKARQLCEKAAAAGEPLAMQSLGTLYERGQGGPQDYGQARQWYEKAAAAGSADAMNNLGLLYEKGLGVEQDYIQARQLYEKAVAAGSIEALSNLAGMYVNGQGGPQDYGQARELCQRAVAAGDPMGMYNMGLLYSDGKGVPKDYVQARQWFEKAAARGIPRAMFSLGLLYASGLGVTQDKTLAREWFQKAAAAGDTDAADVLKTLFE